MRGTDVYINPQKRGGEVYVVKWRGGDYMGGGHAINPYKIRTKV
jgi:hypothetical protein